MNLPKRLWCLLPAALLALPAQAFNEALSGGDFAITREYTDIVVRPDGTYTQTDEIVQRLGSERATHEGGQIKVPFSASLDDLTVIEAYTLKAGGRRIPVPETSIFLQDGLISDEGVSSFHDIKTRVIVYPELEPGDSVALKMVLTRRQPILAGVYSFSRSWRGDVRYEDSRVSISAAPGVDLRVGSEGLLAAAPGVNGALRTWRWNYRSGPLSWPEENSVDPITYRPRVFATTLKSYEELGRAAYSKFQDKATVTPAIQAQARQLTAGAATPLEKARILHDWVARNIRYFSTVLGIGGYVPRPAEQVLSSRYGDCKDVTVLLQAMLAAVGIASEPALLGTDAIYQLPDLPVMSPFNHVITHIPSLGVYLEATTPWTAFGVLPVSDADKPVLLLGPQPVLARTPALTPEDNRITLRTVINVRADGSASGQDQFTATGSSGLAWNSFADWLASADPARAAKSLLLQAGLIGDGTVTATKLSNAGPFRADLLYELTDFAPPEELGSVRQRMPMDSLESVAMSMVSESSVRKVAYVCFSDEVRQDIEIRFPAGTVLRLPKDTEISQGGRSYRATYRQEGSTVKIERRYLGRLPRGSCEPAEFVAGHAVQQAVLRDFRRDILYTSKPAR